uniref:Uncharacterized protein n=1 Tax=Oryza rufipogon TaxID=4529 RepID=A0A0E0R1H4_ORYRU
MPGAAAGDEAAAAAGGRRPTASERRRMYRDLAQSLRCGLRDASAGFSFLRLRGLRALLRALRSAAADARLFRHSQALRDLQVVPVLFEHSLRRAQGDAVVTVGQGLGISPAVKLSNPATDSEVALALRVLEGCCLLCRDCAAAAHRYDAVKDFKEHEGLDKIGDLVKDTQRDDNVRSASEKGDATFVSCMQEDLKNIVGENCASFICSKIFFSSTLDSEVTEPELNIHAKHYIERFNGSGLAKKSLSTTSMFSSDNY